MFDSVEAIKFALEECRQAFEDHARAGRVALAEKYWKRACSLAAMLEFRDDDITVQAD